MIDAKLLAQLCCPETHQPLKLGDDSLVKTLNERIASGSLKNRAGHLVKGKIDGALIREDAKVAYLIQNKLPILLIDEGVLV
jgi:uncharacterized protein YbaR (Trm112 family)